MKTHNVVPAPRTRRALALCFAACCGCVLAAEPAAPTKIFKVVDQHGKTSYVDQAALPPGVDGAALTSYGLFPEIPARPPAKYPSLQPETTAAGAAAPPSGATLPGASAPDPTKMTREQIAAVNAAIAKRNAENQVKLDQLNCGILKQNMASLNGGRVVRYGENGAPSYLNDEQIAAEKLHTAARLQDTCK